MEYTGYDRIWMSDEMMAQFYEGARPNFDLKENEYLILYDKTNTPIDKYVLQDGELKHVDYKLIDSSLMGKIKPRNVEQELAFHMLQDERTKIKVLTGRYGSGKSMAMIAQGVALLHQGIFEKIVFVRNNINAKDSADPGSLPGTLIEKLYPFLMPMADHLGGRDVLDDYIANGQIEPIHLGFLRGRDLRNSLIYCTEAQNLTVDQLKLLIGRVGEGSELWLDGDFHAQVDKPIFEKSNGLRAVVEKLSGNKYFGYVHLVKSERSEVAALADLLDE